jgi:phage FluMu gp28-like protein
MVKSLRSHEDELAREYSDGWDAVSCIDTAPKLNGRKTALTADNFAFHASACLLRNDTVYSSFVGQHLRLHSTFNGST